MKFLEVSVQPFPPLQVLKSLEVLDLQSNLIEVPLGLSSLTGLRRLNLAGNRISKLCSLHMLSCLEDLSLTRNSIAALGELGAADPEAGSSSQKSSLPLLPVSLRKLALGHNRC